MNLLDSISLWGRRLQPQVSRGTGDRRFRLVDVLQLFDSQLILELTPVVSGRRLPTVRPDSQNKVKVSLLDNGISAIHADAHDWYEVFKSPPSGDLSRVRIVARGGDGGRRGEIRMVLGPRTYEHYFEQDPLLEGLKARSEDGQAS